MEKIFPRIALAAILFCSFAGMGAPSGICGETGGFSAGDAITRPLDIARDAAKKAEERKQLYDGIIESDRSGDSGTD